MKSQPLQMAKNSILVFACMSSISFVKAQKTDSTSEAKAKLPIQKFYNQDAVIRNKFPYRSFVLPAFMIAYGFTTLKSSGLEKVNEKVKEEMTENPHKKIPIDNFLLIAPAAAVYGLNIAGIKGKNNFRDRSIIYLMSNVFTNATVFGLKNLMHQQRPDGSDYASFPSGHTAEAFASAEFLRQEYKGVSPWYGVAGYVAASATGLLRMYNNKHWLSDVVTGAGIGIASTKLAYWIYPVIKRKFFKEKPMNAFVMPYYQSGSAGLSMVYNFHN